MTRRMVTVGILFAFGLIAADELPKADAILDKYIEVTGGKAAYGKVKTDITTGEMTLGAMGIKGKMTMYSQAPDKRVVEINIDGIGKIVEGSDGKIAWSHSAMQGPRLKEGEEKDEALRQGRTNSDLEWRELYTKVETKGMDKVDGKDCYNVEVTPKSGKPQMRCYDKASGLLVRMTATQKSPMGEITADTFPSDYRKEGELIVPHKVTMKMAGQEMVMSIDKVEHNAAIPPEKFEPPAEVKALMSKPAAKQ